MRGLRKIFPLQISCPCPGHNRGSTHGGRLWACLGKAIVIELSLIKSAARSFLSGASLVGGLFVLLLWDLLAALPLDRPLTELRADVASVFLHAQGQWQTFAALFLNACAWTGTPAFLRWRRTGEKPRLDEWALIGLLGLLGLQYSFRYPAAAGSSDALVLLAGIWMASLWRALSPVIPVRGLLIWLWLGMFALALGSSWDWHLFQVFRYREEKRATGLWNNPNTFGLLAACLAAASIAWLLKLAPWRQSPVPPSEPSRGPDFQGSRRFRWLLVLPFLVAGAGLVRSYSRGAWLGMLLALAWCGWWRCGPTLQKLLVQVRAGDVVARRRWIALRALMVVMLCGGLLALWSFKDFQNPLLRRMGTVTNHTDRSWRNRVDAWIGAARMTVARPLTGWGLNQVEEVYRQRFKPAGLKETAAIQLNDYLTLAASMGVPALAAFLLLVGTRLRIAHRERNPNVAPLLVLLVGCWFDGVLFRLALAIPFWTLLLAGTPELRQPFSLGTASGRFCRRLALVAKKRLHGARLALLTERRAFADLFLAAPPPSGPRHRLRLFRGWLNRSWVRRALGLTALLLFVVQVYRPDIRGGLRYRLDPWVRQVAGLVAGRTGTAAKADALQDWMHFRAKQEIGTEQIFGELDWPTTGARGGCRTFCETYVKLALAVGLNARPVYTFWPTIGSSHYWVEVWDAENQRWHAYDVSAENRPWDKPWTHRVPKAVSLVPTEQPGSWLAHDQRQWELLENTIGQHYPSGQVEVRVLDRDQPLPRARVEVQVWLGNGMGGHAADAHKFHAPQLFSVLAGRTDTNGLVRFTLGRSAQQPYRFRLDRPGDADWAWAAVESNSVQRITLRAERLRPYDLKATPPRLPWFQDEE